MMCSRSSRISVVCKCSSNMTLNRPLPLYEPSFFDDSPPGIGATGVADPLAEPLEVAAPCELTGGGGSKLPLKVGIRRQLLRLLDSGTSSGPWAPSSSPSLSATSCEELHPLNCTKLRRADLLLFTLTAWVSAIVPPPGMVPPRLQCLQPSLL